MSSEVKYIGLDVHKEAISIAVLNGSGKLVMESIIETKAVTILQFVQGLRGELHVTLEEGTWAAWMYDLLKPHVHYKIDPHVAKGLNRVPALEYSWWLSDRIEITGRALALRAAGRGQERPFVAAGRSQQPVQAVMRAVRTFGREDRPIGHINWRKGLARRLGSQMALHLY